MFRQIRMHPDDQDWLRILWRNHASDKMEEFRLTTVTYGTVSAPYQAHRVLRQVAEDEEATYPLAARAIQQNSYVDDILAGADDIETATEIKRQLIGILGSAGFPLDKWASPEPALRTPSIDHKVFQEAEVHGALGLRWDTAQDTLAVRGFPLSFDAPISSWTKRKILSDIARLFDPMGWLAPVLIRAKVLLQDLWLAGVDWDEELSPTLVQRWSAFRQDLPFLDQIAVPRWTHFTPLECEVELHGFSDASERAYAAAVFFVARKPSGATSRLLMSKTRVAPLKTTSIPRLELCGAVLLARLLAALGEEIKGVKAKMYGWTDSTVVLHWLRSHPSRWKPFVAHRVAEVQTLLPGMAWRHVGTQDNPADIATRGTTSMELHRSALWWSGPSWIERRPEEWPSHELTSTEIPVPEEKQVKVFLAQADDEEPYLQRFSSLDRLVRVTAHIRRFVARCRAAIDCSSGPLTTTELHEALAVIIRISQRTTFAAELAELKRGRAIPSNSPLKSLSPVVGADNILRVDGRLMHSHLGASHRHPAIIQQHSHLATLILRDAHQKTLHGGVNASLAWVHRAFWIPRSRALAKRVVHDCVTCTRMRAMTGHQRMGRVPTVRTQPSRPFSQSGVDYAGPFPLRTTPGRGHASRKGYVVVFVCMATKAVHLDAVTDLSSAAFLAAFHRFVARRGHCNRLFSDNATTFKGADGLLRQMFTGASSFFTSTAETLANEGTEWTFIPPYSPHMGGLWEAAVKSMKIHLRKVIGDSALTYEEMATLLCRIEACLNSRPLTPLSDDPQDLEVLTPGHFLVGDRLHSPPEPPTTDIICSLTARWRLISNMHRQFWHRWSTEYLHHLQPRHKWREAQPNLRPGRIVLVKDDRTAPTCWPLAIIETATPGPDGLVRVVTLRRGASTFTRAIAKVIPLPVEDTSKSGDTHFTHSSHNA